MKNVLFICTGNSARSIMAEALLNHYGQGEYRAFSAGAKPSGEVNPFTLAKLRSEGIPTDRLRSKPISEFKDMKLDFVVTVCDNARESCPVWPGDTNILHWSFPDPAAEVGTDESKRILFDTVYGMIKEEILRFLS